MNLTNLLENALRTVAATPTPVMALDELPPPVVDEFWAMTRAAIKLVERAHDDELLSDQDERANQAKITELLTRALILYRDGLRRAAMRESKLKREVARWKPEPRLEDVLLRRYFRQIRGFLLRTVKYSQDFLRAYDHHPVFVMDINMLLDAVERLSGYRQDAEPVSPDVSNVDSLYLLRAIAGEAATWDAATSPYSEFNMLNRIKTGTAEKHIDRGREAGDLAQYLSWVWSGASAACVQAMTRWQEHAWEDEALNPTVKLPPDLAKFPEIAADGETREVWFYINGVVTDHWIAQLNAEYLADIFKRPIHILHNPTQGLHRDIRECIRGRVLEHTTRVARDLRRELEEVAGDRGIARVVLIAHSQGTIITSEIVKQLRDHGSCLPGRMEVFNFAFCADEFPEACCRQLEHFVNENDFVPSLSLVPGNPYNVPGRIYRRAGAWGHFLNAHYLDAFHAGAYKDERGDHRSVLFSYIGGGSYGVIAPAERHGSPVKAAAAATL